MKVLSKLKTILLSSVLLLIMIFAASMTGLATKTENEANAYSFKQTNYIYQLASTEKETDTSFSLTDEYPIMPENQTSSKLCWTYASLKALESSLMVQKGEYYNFSELAVGYLGYEHNILDSFDSSGNFFKFMEIVSNYGLVNESEFSNEFYFDMTESNYQNYSYVLEKANTTAIENVDAVSFPLDSTYATLTTDEKQDIIKKFIKKYGGLFCGLEAGTIYPNGAYFYTNDKNKYSDGGRNIDSHAVCLIGWDDRYGFLALNSWGIEEPDSIQKFYIPYSYNFFYSTLAGFVSNAKADTVTLQSSSASKFSNEIKISEAKMKNIICYDESISLKYSVSSLINFSNVYTEIYKGTENITSAFQISYDDTAKTILITASSLPSYSGGTYVLKFYEGTNLISEKEFFVYTGAEIAYFKLNRDALVLTEDSVLLMNGFLRAENSETYYLDSVNNYKLNFYLTNINSWNATRHLRSAEELENYNVSFEVGNLFVYEDDGVDITRSDTGLKFGKEYGTLKDAANTYVVNIPALYNYAGKRLQFTISLTSTVYPSLVRTYYINIFVSSKSSVTTASSKPVTYYLDGGQNSDQNPERIPDYANDATMQRVELASPTKIGYTFMGWYSTDTFDNEVSFITGALGDDIKLYARWNREEVVYFSTSLSVLTIIDYNKEPKELDSSLVYGDSIRLEYKFYEHSELSAYPYNISYVYLLNNVQKQAESLGSGNKTLYFDFKFPDLNVGDYKIDIFLTVVIGHNKSVYESKSYEFSVAKKKVDLEFDDLQFVYDGKSHQPTIKEKGEGFYDEDMEGKTLISMLIGISKANIFAGKYEYKVAGVASGNYELGESSCEYEILQRSVSVVWSENTKTYNGKNQFPKYELVGLVEGDEVSVNLIDAQMKNVGEYNVSLKESTLTNKNYYLEEDDGTVLKIVPAKLTITFSDIKDKASTALEYRKKITYVITGDLFDKESDLGLTIVCDALTSSESGKYRITGTYLNTNYDITFVDATYTLTGNYKIFYTLPDGSRYIEYVEEGEKAKGISSDVYPLPAFSKFKYSESLNSQTGDLHVDVTIENYTWVVVVGAIVVLFVVSYFIITRKQRRNKVS